MAQQTIDATDSLNTGRGKLNTMFTEVYGILIQATNTVLGLVKLYTTTGTNTDGTMTQNAIKTALDLKSDLASPTFTGNPAAPTQSAGDNSTKLATTAYADAKVADAINDGTTAIAPSQNAVFDALALKSPLASPTFTGTPAAPTAAVGTNTTQIATTAHLQAAFGAWTSWTPTWTGFSANPTAVDASYLLINKLCIVRCTMTSGTSNATTLTITNLPAVSKANSITCILGVDNGTLAFGRGDTAAGSSTLTFTRNANGAAWTNTGTKGVFFTITYEVQ